jgi:hypothetical protein
VGNGRQKRARHVGQARTGRVVLYDDAPELVRPTPRAGRPQGRSGRCRPDRTPRRCRSDWTSSCRAGRAPDSGRSGPESGSCGRTWSASWCQRSNRCSSRRRRPRLRLNKQRCRRSTGASTLRSPRCTVTGLIPPSPLGMEGPRRAGGGAAAWPRPCTRVRLVRNGSAIMGGAENRQARAGSDDDSDAPGRHLQRYRHWRAVAPHSVPERSSGRSHEEARPPASQGNRRSARQVALSRQTGGDAAKKRGPLHSEGEGMGKALFTDGSGLPPAGQERTERPA